MPIVELKKSLALIAKDFNLVGIDIVPLSQPQSIQFYRTWLENEYFGEMSYLKEHLPKKEDPKNHWHQAESSIVITKSYVPTPKPLENSETKTLQIARYAQGQDYHHWFKNELLQISTLLKTQFPELELLPMTDSSPVLERDLGAKAGLGWIGKNTCLIHQQKGSFTFIGEIYTSLKFNPNRPIAPIHDFCGKCTKCIDACPTEALLEPRVLDARRCISYWTIESRSTPPIELAEKFGELFFGCDICQSVCPWNQKILNALVANPASLSEVERKKNETDELRNILQASGKTLEKKFRLTPLWRARAFGLRRNAIIVATNGKHRSLLKDIQAHKNDSRLLGLIQWAEEKLIES
jgi:epoxyqueuosine reductase